MGVTTGVVSIEFTVDRNGAVTNAAVVQADPPGVFDDAALRAIRTWKYRPKLSNGTPVASHQRFRFRFE
jgi:protein TonB